VVSYQPFCIEELTAKQKLLQSFLVEAEQNSSSCVEDGEINDQNNTLDDPDFPPF
jgi:hypothetical protein